MRYSYNWLKELSGTKKSPDQIARLLMMHAFEVEEVLRYEHGLQDVVIGKVEGLEQHPNADRLRVAQVRVGRGDVRQVVCGAPNIALGQMVAVVLPGSTLPGGIEISEVKLRDVLSSGMICSARELGLGENHDGILVLPEDAPLGAYFAKYYGLDDTILDIKILPDRGGDALSHEGMAREIAALDGYAPRFTEKPKKNLKIPAYNRAPKVVIADKKISARYSGLCIKGVTVKESPLWLQARLLVLGYRPKNNIVDITNYLMLLSGQPIHAFDADKINEGLSIRRAKKNEKLTLLTDESIKLSAEDIVIADSKKALALAGVMGGASSAITEETENIFVEIAVFEASSIRKTKQKHGLMTDAAFRFERGVDMELATEVLPLASSLMIELAGGKLFGLRDIRNAKHVPHKVLLSEELVLAVLGVRVPLFEIVRLLALLGLKVKKKADKAVLEVTVPSRRPDLIDAWNLIEEIGRMRGYDKITPSAPVLPLTLPHEESGKKKEMLYKTKAVAFGFDEVMTYSFYGSKDIEAALLTEGDHAELESPLSPEYTYLRATLVPLLLRKAKENLRNFDTFTFFEYGSTFAFPIKGALKELKELAFVQVGKAKSEEQVVLSLKENVRAYLASLAIGEVTFSPLDEETSQIVKTFLHPTRGAEIRVHGVTVGYLGEIHPRIAKNFGLPENRVAVASFDSENLWHGRNTEKEFIPLQKFPYATRDITLWFPRTVMASDALEVVRTGGGELLKEAELFAIYEKEEEKSYSFHLAFGATDRTLTTEEMDVSFDTIVSLAKERFGGYIRY
ncbi:MAG: phenylalanine--tRNA ligase subunit beta [Candidatus Moranbacteria bacterium]|nr:phenylalanine--tRNA ligase subunit beta [Candidatus Moranbacteria bacterium]